MKYAQNLDISKYCTQSNPFILKSKCHIHNNWKPNMQKFWIEVTNQALDALPFIIFSGIVCGLIFAAILRMRP